MTTEIDPDAEKCAIAPWANTGQMQVIATTAIASGETIFTESPLAFRLVANGRYPSSQWDLVNDFLEDQRLRRELRSWELSKDGGVGLDPDDEEVVRELSARHHTSAKNVEALYATVATNNIGLPELDGTIMGYGMFRQLSRCNHACDPSAGLGSYGDQDDPTAVVFALRDIEAGEPITWRYMDFQRHGNCAEPLSDFHVRNWLLVEHYGFACKCDLCIAQTPEEIRGKDIYQVYQQLLFSYAKTVFDEAAANSPPGSTIEIPAIIYPAASPWRKH